MPTTVTSIRAEHLDTAFGVGTPTPRLSWTVRPSTPDWTQRAHEIEVADGTGRVLVGSGPVRSERSVLVDWPGSPLASRQRCRVRVRVHGDGDVSPWSAPLVVEAGLFDPTDWVARFITAPGAVPVLRRVFPVAGPVRRARLYATALGVYELRLNGQPVGDHVLAPGWTSYHHRLRYQTHDVTDLLRPGANLLDATLAEGWYRGRLGWGGGERGIYGDDLALLAQLEITHDDGTTTTVATDETWQAGTGPLLESGIYDGETHDARRDTTDWAPVRTLDRDLSILCGPTGPPVRRTETLPPAAITRSASGATIVDFGQNIAGRVRLTVNAPAGTEITVRHAELLLGGELETGPLRLAKATDRYTARGGGREVWEPSFTYHGFRYAEITGWQPDAVRAVVCHSDLTRTGWFECSDPMLNRLHENIVWTMRGNFFDIPTDCPQRDERLGWTADAALFAPSACFLYDTAGVLGSWLTDLAADRDPATGVPPVMAPAVRDERPPLAVWCDAVVTVPWVLYERYGDLDFLARQYESMCSWVDHVSELTGERRIFDQHWQLGDWLDPTAPPDKPRETSTDPFLIATAYFAHSARRLADAAELLAKPDDARRYADLADAVRRAFLREYTDGEGRLLKETQTGYALARQFGLLYNGPRLAELVTAADGHPVVGFIGASVVLDALTDSGRLDLAYRMLTKRGHPSWLYQVDMGATTVWERWDSLRPDGTLNPGEMTSFNHCPLGSVADWMHRTIGGLAPAAPGYRRLRIAPQPGGGVTWANTTHRTPYGTADVRWRLDGGHLHLDVVVPAGTRAEVTLPMTTSPPVVVGSGEHHWAYQV